jgi:hypothetical protein
MILGARFDRHFMPSCLYLTIGCMGVDFIIYATPHRAGLGVWKFPTKAVRARAELVQAHYDEIGRAGMTASLWLHLESLPNRQGFAPCQLNFAEGKAPIWLLPPVTEAPEAEAVDGSRNSAISGRPQRSPSGY